MAEDDLLELVRRWFGIWGEEDLSSLDEICADPYIRHTSTGSERISLDEYKKKLVQTRQVLRDAVTSIDDQVISGSTVWTRATSRGVNLATEERAVVTWMVTHRIENGRIAETWAAALAGVEWKTPD